MKLRDMVIDELLRRPDLERTNKEIFDNVRVPGCTRKDVSQILNDLLIGGLITRMDGLIRPTQKLAVSRNLEPAMV